MTDKVNNEKILGREDILQASDFHIEKVPVPEWGGVVLVKSLNGKERDQYEAAMTIQRKGNVSFNFDNMRSKLLVMCVVDKDGNEIFTEQDIKALGAKSAQAMQRVFLKARELAGLSDEDLDELLGNSEPDQSASSTSG